MNTMSNSNPDEAVLSLARQYDDLARQVERRVGMIDPYKPKRKQRAECEEIFAELRPLVAAIFDTRAVTMEGLIAKAKVASWWHAAVDPIVAESLVRDLVALAPDEPFGEATDAPR
jgi:hypothetical protein